VSLVQKPLPTRPVEFATSPARGADTSQLLAALATLRGQARRWIWVESLAMIGLLATVIFWGSLAIDWSIEPPPSARILLALAAIGGLVWLITQKLLLRLATPLKDSALAIIIERGHAIFRDSLSTAIELSARPASEVDPSLLARTTQEAVAMLGEFRPGTLFRRQRLSLLAGAGLLAVGSVAGLVALKPAIADLWVQRMVLLSEAPWPRRVRLTIDDFPDGVRTVARGSDVDVVVRARVSGAGFTTDSSADRKNELPSIVDLRSRGATGWRSDRMGMRGGVTDEEQAFGHILKNISEDLLLEVRGGDAKIRNLRLKAVDAPSLGTLAIRYSLPAYLGGGTRQAPAARIVQIPKGSRVEIECTSTKPLSAAIMTSTAAAKGAGVAENKPQPQASEPIQEIVLGSLEMPLDKTALSLEPPRLLTGRIASLLTDCTISVRLTDTDNLVNREPITFILSSLADEPPQVAVRMRGISTMVTPQARIPLEGTISDDHALAAATVRLTVAERPEVTLAIARLQVDAAMVDLSVQDPEVVVLEPLGLKPSQKLTISVTAVDACTLDGVPNSGTSDAWSLDVVAPEVLLAMLEAREIILRRRFESCIADFAQTRNRVAGFAGSAPEESGAGGKANLSDSELPSDAARLGEATSRAGGETSEISIAFRDIRLELENNLLLTPELQSRLIVQIADPLTVIASKDLPALSAQCRGVAENSPANARSGLVEQADLVLARMQAVLDKMMELESFNEVIELLRGVIRTQEEIKTNTLEWQKKRARDALEQP